VKIVRMALVSSALYGARCMGVSDTLVEELRIKVATAESGNNAGRSTTLMLLLADNDPGEQANMAPIGAWMQAWHQAANDERLKYAMIKAWRHWLPIIWNSKNPWKVVNGPAPAYLATVRRLGWQTLGPGVLSINGKLHHCHTENL
jgi:hypothetical protein